jgi:hypothetical protein
MYFLFARFGNPLLFVTSQRAHGWLQYGYFNLVVSMDLFNAVFIVLILLAVWYWWSRRKSFAIYSLLFLAIPVIGKQYGGFNRYALVIFPVQLMLYKVLGKRQYAYSFVMIILGIAWAYTLLQYAGSYIGS